MVVMYFQERVKTGFGQTDQMRKYFGKVPLLWILLQPYPDSMTKDLYMMP